MTLEEKTQDAAWQYSTFDQAASAFIDGANWERNRDKWISVKDEWPEAHQRVIFVVDVPGTPRNGLVYGGRFTGYRKDDGTMENEFSTPGYCAAASHWQPLPKLPK